jgi:hypothetical protein
VNDIECEPTDLGCNFFAEQPCSRPRGSEAMVLVINVAQRWLANVKRKINVG